MHIFLDSTNTDEIQETIYKGLVHGVVTTACPLTYSSKSKFMEQVVNIIQICRDAGNLPVFIDLLTHEESMTTYMINMSRELDYEQLVFKLPIDFEVFKYIHTLSTTKININSICCVNATQMQCAAIGGAKYVSLSYADAASLPKSDEVAPYSLPPARDALLKTKTFIFTNKIMCHVIADNLETSQHVRDAWSAGADALVIQYDLLKQLINHDKTKDIIQKYRQRFQKWMT